MECQYPLSITLDSRASTVNANCRITRPKVLEERDLQRVNRSPRVLTPPVMGPAREAGEAPVLRLAGIEDQTVQGDQPARPILWIGLSVPRSAETRRARVQRFERQEVGHVGPNSQWHLPRKEADDRTPGPAGGPLASSAVGGSPRKPPVDDRRPLADHQFQRPLAARVPAPAQREREQ